MGDIFKILKVEYFSNFNPKLKIACNENNLQWKRTLEY